MVIKKSPQFGQLVPLCLDVKNDVLARITEQSNDDYDNGEIDLCIFVFIFVSTEAEAIRLSFAHLFVGDPFGLLPHVHQLGLNLKIFPLVLLVLYNKHVITHKAPDNFQIYERERFYGNSTSSKSSRMSSFGSSSLGSFARLNNP